MSEQDSMLGQFFTWTNLVRTTATVVLEAYVWTQMAYLPVWFLNITATLAALTILLPNLEPRFRGRGARLFHIVSAAIPVRFVISILLGFFGEPFFRSPPFRTEARTVLNSSPIRKQLTPFVVTHGNPSRPTVSPVPFLIYLEVVNLQSVPSRISDYSVAIGRCYLYGWWCKWYPLPTIPLESSALFFLLPNRAPNRTSLQNKPIIWLPTGSILLAPPEKPEYLASALLLQPDRLFDTELHRTIPSHETIAGWAAFDHSQGFKVFKGPNVYFRISVRDSAGIENVTVYRTPLYSNELMSTTMATLTLTGIGRDLRHLSVESYTKE
jgi:hypothetical protein